MNAHSCAEFLLEGPIERICVFRALMLGDLLCAVPAMRALRAAFPSARITLVSLPWARVLAGRLPYVDEIVEFPGYPGLPEIDCQLDALPSFLAQMQAQRFDLALQLHGSGTIVNPLVASFGARQTAGFFNDAAWVPPQDARRYIRWRESGHEINRLLSLIDALGIARCGTHLEYPVNDEDRELLWAQSPLLTERPYVCIHVGAQLPSRRWQPRRFASVGDALARMGYTVVLTGTAVESTLVATVADFMQEKAISLAGQTNLWTLGALIDGAACMVCNDTGVSHIAAALGTPSVVISCGAEVARWAPLDACRHRVLWADMPCRPCSLSVCPEPRGCAAAIEVAEVLEAFCQLVDAVRVPQGERQDSLLVHCSSLGSGGDSVTSSL